MTITATDHVRDWSTISADTRDFEQRRLNRFLNNMADAYNSYNMTAEEATVRTAVEALRTADKALVTEALLVDLTELHDRFIAGHNREDASTIRRTIHELQHLDQWVAHVA
jgi:predicted HD phosphohydrolase